jgi:hypothetical protein
MSRRDILRIHGFALLQFVVLLIDLAGNFILSVAMFIWALVTGQEGQPACAYETLSSRAGRAAVNRKLSAKVLRPVIDCMFFWQRPEVRQPDGKVFHHPSHSVRTFLNTYYKNKLPPEYRQPLPPELRA